MEWRTFLNHRATLEYKGFARAGWVGDYMDPFTFLDLFSHGGRRQRHRLVRAGIRRDAHRANRSRIRRRRYAAARRRRKDLLDAQPIIPLATQRDELDEETVREGDVSQSGDDSRLEVRVHRARPRQVGSGMPAHDGERTDDAFHHPPTDHHRADGAGRRLADVGADPPGAGQLLHRREAHPRGHRAQHPRRSTGSTGRGTCSTEGCCQHAARGFRHLAPLSGPVGQRDSRQRSRFGDTGVRGLPARARGGHHRGHVCRASAEHAARLHLDGGRHDRHFAAELRARPDPGPVFSPHLVLAAAGALGGVQQTSRFFRC